MSILYTLDGGSVTLECYKEEESYWFSLKSVVKILDDEAGQSSEEAREVSWIEQTKSWGGWQYRMTSWRSNQIEELFDLEEEIEAPEE